MAALPETTVVTFVLLTSVEAGIVTVDTRLLAALVITVVTVDALTRGIVPSGFHRVSSLAKGGHFVNHLFNDPREYPGDSKTAQPLWMMMHQKSSSVS